MLRGEHGDILAVNAPPGTGKTTLLLSVVATLWAKAALEGGEPPVIVAASTNNQAVTNIIDAFGKDFARGSGVFAGRWVPGVESFGAYFPHGAKKKRQRKNTKRAAFLTKLKAPNTFIMRKRLICKPLPMLFPLSPPCGKQ